MPKIAQQVTTYQVMLSIRKKFTNDLHVRLQVGVRQEELIPASVRSPGNHPWVWINTRPDSGPRPSLRVLRTAGFVVEPGTKLRQLDRSSVLSHLLWAVKSGPGEDAGKQGKRTRRKLSSSFSNTGSVQDYFQDILAFPRLLTLRQCARSWRANATGRGPKRKLGVKQLAFPPVGHLYF